MQTNIIAQSENTPKPEFELKDIPPEFILRIYDKGGKESIFIRLGGLLYLASKMGVFKCETKDVSTQDSEEIKFECKGWIIPSEGYLESKGISEDSPFIEMFKQPVVAHGTTNQWNLKNSMSQFAYVMAETRSVSRCLRILTECPYCSEEEIESYTFSSEELVKNAKVENSTITSASNMLTAPPKEPTTRAQLIRTITDFNIPSSKKNDVKKYIKDFIDSHGANVIANLSDSLLKELYNGIVQMVAE